MNLPQPNILIDFFGLRLKEELMELKELSLLVVVACGEDERRRKW